MTGRVLVLCLSVVECASSLSLAAQQPTLPSPGSRIRVRAPTHAPQRIVGTFVSLANDTLMVQPLAAADAGRSVRLPLSAVTDFEVSQGIGRAGGKGALIGAVAGVPLGVAVGLWMQHRSCEGQLGCVTSSDAAVLGGAIGVATGGLIGWVIGRSTHRERWARESLTVGAIIDGARLGLVVRLARGVFVTGAQR